MKVKTIFASMVVLGLVSGTAIAAQPRNDIAGLVDRAATAQQSKTGNWLSDHVKVGAQLNVDAGFSNRTRGDDSGLSGAFDSTNDSGKKSSSDIYVKNSNISLDFMPSNWVDAHVELTATGADSSATTVSAVEAFTTVGDLSKSPFFMSAGKEFLPFGQYDAYALTPSITQSLAEMSGTVINVGYAQAKGFRLSGYMMRGSEEAADGNDNNHKTVNTGGLDVGYNWCDKASQTGFNLGASWINNMLSAHNVADWTDANKIGGFSFHAGGHMKQFDASADLVMEGSKQDNQTADRFYAYGLDAGYSFNMAGHESRVGLGYQGSRHLGITNNPAVHTNFLTAGATPKHRFLADWTVGVMKNTNVELQYTYDKDYASDGDATQASDGTGMSASTIKARLSVDLL